MVDCVWNDIFLKLIYSKQNFNYCANKVFYEFLTSYLLRPVMVQQLDKFFQLSQHYCVPFQTTSQRDNRLLCKLSYIQRKILTNSLQPRFEDVAEPCWHQNHAMSHTNFDAIDLQATKLINLVISRSLANTQL